MTRPSVPPTQPQPASPSSIASTRKGRRAPLGAAELTAIALGAFALALAFGLAAATQSIVLDDVALGFLLNCGTTFLLLGALVRFQSSIERRLNEQLQQTNELLFDVRNRLGDLDAPARTEPPRISAVTPRQPPSVDRRLLATAGATAAAVLTATALAGYLTSPGDPAAGTAAGAAATSAPAASLPAPTPTPTVNVLPASALIETLIDPASRSTCGAIDEYADSEAFSCQTPTGDRIRIVQYHALPSLQLPAQSAVEGNDCPDPVSLRTIAVQTPRGELRVACRTSRYATLAGSGETGNAYGFTWSYPPRPNVTAEISFANPDGEAVRTTWDVAYATWLEAAGILLPGS